MKRFSIIICLLVTTTAFAQDWDKVEIKTHLVRGSIYMLEGPGGNIGVSVGDDGIVVVDDKYAPLVPKITEALAEIADTPVRFVLNTHWHGDHTGGNELLGESAPIIAHHNVRKRLGEGMDLPDQKVEPAPAGALPVITFSDNLSIHLNGEEVRAIHMPAAHTDGDAVIYFASSNVVHLGDTFFSGLFPYIDIDSGGSSDGLIAGLEAVFRELDDDVILIPGHGPISKKEDLQRYLEMIKATRVIVKDAVSAGKSTEQILSENLLADYESWSWSFISTERWVRTLVRELG